MRRIFQSLGIFCNIVGLNLLLFTSAHTISKVVVVWSFFTKVELPPFLILVFFSVTLYFYFSVFYFIRLFSLLELLSYWKNLSQS